MADAREWKPSYADTVRAIAAPDLNLWAQQAYEKRGDAQGPLFNALGEREARPSATKAAALKPAADTQRKAIDNANAAANDAAEVLRESRALVPYRHRAPGDTKRKWFFVCVLLLGDVAGATGAAITQGEIPVLAFVQMLAAGAAAVCAGFVAGELRKIREARRRLSDQPPTECERWGHLFAADRGERVALVSFIGALAIGAFLAGAIGTLRWANDGPLSGILFACLTLAITGGSAANAWLHADEIADAIGHCERDFRRASRKALKQACKGPLAEYERNLADAASIRSEHDSLGIAAEHQVQAARFAWAAENPGKAGDGPRDWTRPIPPSSPPASTMSGSRNGNGTWHE